MHNFHLAVIQLYDKHQGRIQEFLEGGGPQRHGIWKPPEAPEF